MRETEVGVSRMSSQTFARRLGRKRRNTYGLDVAHGLVLLFSPSRSPPVVVSVSVPTSDNVRVRVSLKIKIEADYHRPPVDAHLLAGKDAKLWIDVTRVL